MRESFVFHADFIDHLPEELKVDWAMYCINYGLYGEEPQFKDVLHAELWRKLKDRIDNDSESYENKKINQRIWRARNHAKEGRATQEEIKLLQDLGILGTPKNSQNSQNLPLDTRYEYESDSVSEYDSVYEYEFESVSDSVSVSDSKTPTPSTMSKQQENYSKKVFQIFKEAGLPCAKENEISFLQTDFKNAISFIHKSDELKNFTSADIIAACKNYISVLNDTDCYFKQKLNFFGLVKSKIFYDLLPNNFDINNFKRFKDKGISAGETEKPEKKVFASKPCPACGGTKVWWSQKAESYICDDCQKKFGFDEYLGGS